MTRSAAGSLQVHVGLDAWGLAPVDEERLVALVETETRAGS